MFGFLRSRPGMLSAGDWTALNGLHCGLCNVFRREYGTWACLFANWEGRFLALLTHAQYAEETKLITTRCPALLWLRRCPAPETNTALQYATAAVMRLVQEKLADNIRDEKTICTKWIIHWFKRHFDRAECTLKRLDFPTDTFDTLLARQYAIESYGQMHEFDDATAPFARAMGLLTAHTCRIAEVPENYDTLDQIGRLIGRVITIIDACHDFGRDYEKSRYNVIRATTSCKTPGNGLSASQIEMVENYLLLNLNAIRRNAMKLVCYRNTGAVQNILLLGLYDVSMQAIKQIPKNTAFRPMRRYKTHACTSCGHLMNSRFCPHCGRNSRVATVAVASMP